MAGLSCGEPSQMAWDIIAKEATTMTIPDNVVLLAMLACPGGEDTPIQSGESVAGNMRINCCATTNN